MNLCYLIFFIYFFAFKIETGKIRPNFDEIFGDGWNKNDREEKEIKTEQNYQNVQKENSGAVDQMGGEMGNDPNDQQKREIIQKFDAIKEKMKEKGKYHWENRSRIECKIGKLLGSSRLKIYKWKKEMNLNKNKMMEKSFYEMKKKEFIERIVEFKSLYGQRKQKEFMKELGISKDTFIRWKKELLPNYNKKPYTNVEKLEMMKQYFEIKDRNPKISDEIIAKELGIGWATIKRWKKDFALI